MGGGIYLGVVGGLQEKLLYSSANLRTTRLPWKEWIVKSFAEVYMKDQGFSLK